MLLISKEFHPILCFYSSLPKILCQISTGHIPAFAINPHITYISYIMCGRLEKLICSDLWTSNIVFLRSNSWSVSILQYPSFTSVSLGLHLFLPHTSPYSDIPPHFNVLSLVELLQLTSDIATKGNRKTSPWLKERGKQLSYILIFEDISQINQCLHRCALDADFILQTPCRQTTMWSSYMELVDRPPCGQAPKFFPITCSYSWIALCNLEPNGNPFILCGDSYYHEYFRVCIWTFRNY